MKTLTLTIFTTFTVFLTAYKKNKGPIPSHPPALKRRCAHFASWAPPESSPNPAHCSEFRLSIAGFPANGCIQTSRHPVEAVSGRNMGKAGTSH